MAKASELDGPGRASRRGSMAVREAAVEAAELTFRRSEKEGWCARSERESESTRVSLRLMILIGTFR